MAGRSFIGVGIALGLAVGAGLGVAVGNLTMGIAVGVAIGVALGLALDARDRKSGKGDDGGGPVFSDIGKSKTKDVSDGASDADGGGD